MNINLLLSHRFKCLFFVVPMLLSIGVFGVSPEQKHTEPPCKRFFEAFWWSSLKQPQTLEFQLIAFAFM